MRQGEDVSGSRLSFRFGVCVPQFFYRTSPRMIVEYWCPGRVRDWGLGLVPWWEDSCDASCSISDLNTGGDASRLLALYQ